MNYSQNARLALKVKFYYANLYLKNLLKFTFVGKWVRYSYDLNRFRVTFDVTLK